MGVGQMGGESFSPRIFLQGNSLQSQVSETQNEESPVNLSVPACLSVSVSLSLSHTHSTYLALVLDRENKICWQELVDYMKNFYLNKNKK